jgi:hypothetical protein
METEFKKELARFAKADMTIHILIGVAAYAVGIYYLATIYLS